METTSLYPQQLKPLGQYLKLATLVKQALPLAEQAKHESWSYEDYLLRLLEIEQQHKQNHATARRLRQAHFPYQKTFDDFDFSLSPHLPQTQIQAWAQQQLPASPMIFMGEPGTGKTHLAIALGYQVAYLGFKVQFITLANLANQLVEAKDGRTLSNTISRYSKVDLLILDEWGYVPLSQIDAELVFQILSQRQEKRPLIITTNLPFSEWIKVIADPRLCKAVIDRVTHRASIIETGEQSMRLQQTLKKNKKLSIQKQVEISSK